MSRNMNINMLRLKDNIRFQIDDNEDYSSV